MRRTRSSGSLWAGSWTALAGIVVGVSALWTHDGRTQSFEEGQAAQLTASKQTAAADRPQSDWFRRHVQAASGAIPIALDPDTGGFPGVTLQGSSSLEGDEQRVRAARAELARWSAGGELPITTQRLEAEVPQDEAWTLLTVEAEGKEAETLATLQHLLAAPGPANGYLTDPARVVIDVVGRGRLRFELQLRVWPIDAFVAQEGGES